MTEAHSIESALDRRASLRFPLRLALSYRTLNPASGQCSSSARTVNISSSGLLFEDHGSLHPGQHVLVSVEWPARLDHRIPLNLILEGRIVWAANGYAAMRVHRHEFKTRGSAPVPCAPENNQRTDADTPVDRPAST
ncbi:MAG: PilZ domain-containing protein [Bryobacteraceae bacterium]